MTDRGMPNAVAPKFTKVICPSMEPPEAEQVPGKRTNLRISDSQSI